MAAEDDAGDAETGAPPSPPAFSVLHDKPLAVDQVALCPKMDLAAVLMADGSLSVVRTISWQRLHAIPASELQDEHRVTALAWSPDGNVVALGHARGGLSMLDIDAAEPAPQATGFRPDTNEQSEVSALAWLTQHKDSAAFTALDKEKEQTAARAQYYLQRDGVFLEDLPVLGQGAQGQGIGGGAAASSFVDTRERREAPLGRRLAAAFPALDVLIAGFKSGGLLLLASGIFPLLSLRVHDLIPPSLLLNTVVPMTPSPSGGGARASPMAATSTPTASTTNNNNSMMVTPAKRPGISPATPPTSGGGGGGSGKKRPIAYAAAVTAPTDLGALVVAVAAAGPQSFLLSVPTPALWRNRHQLKPVVAEFAALKSLVERVQEALDQGERMWRDGVRVLDMKLELFNNLLRDYGCQASAREAFLSLVLTGVSCPALDQYLSQNSSEPQRHNTFRLSKAVDEKCAGLEALLREQVGRAAETVVFRASKLRGLARVGDEFREVGLSAAALSSLVEAAVRLGLKAEEALRTVQATRQSLRVFLLWLLDTMQQHHAKEEPAPKGGGGGGFRHVPKHVRLLLAFLRRPPLPLGPGGQKPGNTEAIVGGTPISAYFKDAPLPQREDTVEVEKDEDEPDELAATSLRTQGHALRAAFEAVFRRPLDVLRHQLGPARLLRLPPSSAVPPALYTPPSMCPAVLCAAVCPECAILLVLDPSAQTAPVAVAIEPPPGRRWQQAALYGPVPLAPSQNEEALILLARGEKASGGAGSGRASAEVWRLPLAGLLAALAPLPPPPPVSSSSAADAGAAAAASWSLSPSLLLGAARLSMAEVEGAKGRELTQMAPKPLRLAVTGSRGVAAVSSHVNYLTLLDLEEDEEQEDAMEEED